MESLKTSLFHSGHVLRLVRPQSLVREGSDRTGFPEAEILQIQETLAIQLQYGPYRLAEP
jgi:hypothetical protein